MSSVVSTSTMKSPPLVDWLTGPFDGGIVSGAAACLLPLGGSVACVLAATGGARAAAPASVAPLRKLRRPVSGALLRFGIGTSREAVSVPLRLRTEFICLRECCVLLLRRQDD